MTNFPAIAPTRRSYRAPQFPTKRFDSISGAGVTRLYGSQSFGAQLQLDPARTSGCGPPGPAA